MESSSAEVTASAGSAESGESLTTSSSRSEISGSEWTPPGGPTTSSKPKKSNKVALPDGTFTRSATPSQSDPDINAIFQAVISEVDGQRVFRCTKCGNDYSRPYSARRHANVHLRDSNVDCGICKIRLTGPLSLALHMKDKHKGHKGRKSSPLQTVKKIAKSSSSTETSRTRAFSVKDRLNAASSHESVITRNPPASKKTSNLDINSNLKSKIFDCVATKQAAEAVIDPAKEPKEEPIDPPHERRSTRIQMRMAMEASAIEEEERSIRPRKDTPPPIYPSNLEKMKEIKESKARRAQSVQRHVQQLQQQESDMKQEESDDVIVERVVAGSSTDQKRSSRAGSYARASSSREGLVAKRDAAPAAAGGGVRRTKPVYPIAAAAGRRASHALISPLPPFSSFLTPPSSAMTPATMGSSMGSAHFLSPDNNDGISSHYARPGSQRGPPVHQHQSVFTAPAASLYPAPLSPTLLHTIYAPAWLAPTVMGEDEKRALAQCGHTNLMLPARMHHTSTMISKCLKALKETSMPVPPLQPLLPASCPLLQHESCDPLTDVLESVPRISPTSYPSHRVQMAVQPKYTVANEGVRYHMMMTKQLAVENEDWNKKWWEVRTFPSFRGLTTSGSRASPPTSDDGTVIPAGGTGTYTMAGHWTRRHAMKCTYVTPKKPVFSVAESQPVVSRLTPCYSTPGSSCSLTPRSTPQSVIAVSCIAEPPTTALRRPAAPRRPGAAARAAMAAAAAQRKRPAAETEPGNVDAQVKRIKTSFCETFPGRPTDHRPMSQLLQQKSAQLMQQAMQAVQGYCITEAAPSTSNVTPTPPDRQEEIAIDQDGTTFTVL